MHGHQVRETIQGFHNISLRRFWKGTKAAAEKGVRDDGAPVVGGIVAVSMRDQLYVMARWFPPPPREDLV